MCADPKYSVAGFEERDDPIFTQALRFGIAFDMFFDDIEPTQAAADRSIMVRKVVNVNTVPVQTIIAKVVSSVLILRVPAPEDIIAKVVSSVHILRVPVLTAVKVVNSVLTLRVLVPAVIIKAATVLIVLVPVVIKVVDTIVPIAPVRLIITRMQSIV